MRTKPFGFFSRAAMMLLMMMLTATTAWANDAVTYIDMDGKTQTVTEYTEVTSGMSLSWASGTYVVKSDVTLSGRIRFDHPAVIDLIVCDGKTLTVNGGSDDAFEGNTLNIYAQSSGTGVVNAKKATSCSLLNIAGGKVTLDADGDSYGLYIFDGDDCGLTVNGGDVTIRNNNTSQGAIFFDEEGFVTQNGGKLTVTNNAGNDYNAIQGGGDNTINFNGGTAEINGRIDRCQDINLNSGTADINGGFVDCRNINLNGGNVTVNGEIYNTLGYTVTYGFTSATDSYYIQSFGSVKTGFTRTVKIASGKVFAYTSDGGTRTFLGPGEVTLTADEVSAIAGKTLVPQPQFQRVTDVSQLESGKRYLIVAESGGTYYAWSGFSTGMYSGTATTISVSNGTITSAGNATPFLLVESGDMWKIIDLSTEKYVGVPGSNVNKLSESSAFNSDRFLWNISFDNSGKVNVYQSGSEQYLKFTYSPYLGAFFSIFSQSDQSVISLYKETGETVNTLILQNGSDNSSAISEAANSTCNVILEDRILYKDGNWNTLCLPFNHDKTGPLADANIMELDTEGKYKYDNEKWEIDATNGTQKTGFNAADGTLYLFFKTAESIEAGKPYIIKWEGASSDIASPIFSNVTVSSTTSDVPSSDGYVTFKGGYDAITWDTENKSILFLGTENTLYYPLAGASLGAFRAYFQLNGINANVREFNLNFEDGTQTTGIIGHTDNTDNTDKADAAWYTINGVRLSAKPTAKGLYVHGNRKVVIK